MQIDIGPAGADNSQYPVELTSLDSLPLGSNNLGSGCSTLYRPGGSIGTSRRHDSRWGGGGWTLAEPNHNSGSFLRKSKVDVRHDRVGIQILEREFPLDRGAIGTDRGCERATTRAGRRWNLGKRAK